MNCFWGVSELKFYACLPRLPLALLPIPLALPPGFWTAEDDCTIMFVALLNL